MASKGTTAPVVEETAKEKPRTRWIATNGSFPGFWGAHHDGPGHAIVECIRAGADRGSIFVVYEAYDGCYIDEMGSSTYLTEWGNPFDEPEGVYDATGGWLGENLAEVAKEAQDVRYGRDWALEHPVLSKETVSLLKKHKPE